MTSHFRKAALVALPLLAISAGAQALNTQAPPTYDTIYLNTDFRPDPFTRTLSAGGTRSASEAGANCSGYVAGAPDFNLQYQAGQFPLSIYVQSQADTTLVINDASGNWRCNDDYSGTNPAITWNNPPSGRYNIWVGTYDTAGNYPDASLHISEIGPFQQTSGGGNAAGNNSSGIEWGDNTSQWANDNECDDPRFAGPGMHSILLDEDRYHDANDCRRLYEQGQIYLR
ncbi:hypothetical protein ACFPTY_00845 [Halomonas beimenensis]|uniref:Uncharacterized protein n=1 Tax=Halomonas beimenensis TaxID=475662 RepID=A0A291P3Q4_9GAMM|nr:hypothetical protein [Halomonas beimenensis]ATJ81500.1 hypothetical protein BEI_0513 [Halomonas beimenensis]